jgi:hypothetical protein
MKTDYTDGWEHLATASAAADNRFTVCKSVSFPEPVASHPFNPFSASVTSNPFPAIRLIRFRHPLPAIRYQPSV